MMKCTFPGELSKQLGLYSRFLQSPAPQQPPAVLVGGTTSNLFTCDFWISLRKARCNQGVKRVFLAGSFVNPMAAVALAWESQ